MILDLHEQKRVYDMQEKEEMADNQSRLQSRIERIAKNMEMQNKEDQPKNKNEEDAGKQNGEKVQRAEQENGQKMVGNAPQQVT